MPEQQQQQSPQNGGALTEQQRKRVSLILNSEAFQRELDEIIQSQVRSGSHPASLMALQQIADLLLPTARGGGGGGIGGSAGHQHLPPPINDIRGSDVGHYCGGRAERQLRCKLAAAHRLMHIRGWADGFYCQAFARAGPDTYLAKPTGLASRETTASSLSRVHLNGSVADPGSTVFGCVPPEQETWSIVSALFASRPDSSSIGAVVLLQTPELLAAVNCRAGLMPLCAEAQLLGRVAVISDVSPNAVAAAADGANALLLPGRCACVFGDTVESAWRRAELLVAAADAQLETLRSVSLENLCLSAAQDEAGQAQMEKTDAAVAEEAEGNGDGRAQHREWSFGQLEFEAAMRQLDASGYRTGYDYLEPSVRAARPGDVFVVLDQRAGDEDGEAQGRGDGGTQSGGARTGGLTSDSENERPNVSGDTLKSDATSGGEETADTTDSGKKSKKKGSGGGFRIPSFSRGKKKDKDAAANSGK